MEGIRLSMSILLGIQVLLIILGACFLRYGKDADAKVLVDKDTESVKNKYPMFQDVHVMIFIGFGFLMTFLKRYGFSSLGFSFLLTSVVVQWAIFCRGIFHLEEDDKIHLNMLSLVNADIAAASVLISMGAVLGRTTPIQLVIMGLVETLLFSVNEHILIEYFKIADMGGSLIVHVFGAYFGLAVSLVLKPPKGNGPESSSYTSDLFAMIGTLFLWVFWPSFNGALAEGDNQLRAVLNTYLALAACCVTAYSVSTILSEHKKFDMVHIQNATLAGGVAVGAAADLMLHPYGALLVGATAGVISVAGYRYLQPILLEKIKLHDTCGVHNLHGLPGLFAGFVAALVSYQASESEYGMFLYSIFPARAPLRDSPEFQSLVSKIDVDPGTNRTAFNQACFQIVAIPCTLAFSIIGGVITVGTYLPITYYLFTYLFTYLKIFIHIKFN
ncbi:ammonium transporter Rh type B-like [Nilaparvata lugens]|uniref:ammonium transporter Rh type B-like n=1 Tax=Nilaparvata lugens TaxID=108931 RepID=UPI00193DDEC0|nr:ammonium transporter Rh type B-like [Nilaparvata lugens]